MTAVVEGIYERGNIQLLDPPQGMPEGPIRLIMISQKQAKPPSRYMTFGKYGGGVETTLADFKVAEWQGDNILDEPKGR